MLLLPLLVAGLWFAPMTSSAQNNPLNEDHVTWDILTPTLEGAPGEKVTVKFRANLKPGVYMYGQKTYADSLFGPTPTVMTTGGSKGLRRSGGLRANKALKKKIDEGFEGLETESWSGTVTFSVRFTINKSAQPGDIEEGWVNLSYQTCNAGTCKPPLDSKFPFKVTVIEDVAAIKDSIKKAQADSTDMADSIAAYQDSVTAYEDSIAAMAAETAGIDLDSLDGIEASAGSPDGSGDDGDSGLLTYLLTAMGSGFGALFMPCVFPMIPITVSFFTKREQATRAAAVKDAGIYGLGIISTFTGIGVIVSLIVGPGAVPAIATNPWVNIGIAGIFIAFALNLFGLFEIRIPSSILNRLNTKANAGTGVMSILLMGIVFSLTSFTCTVPFVGNLLVGLSGEGVEWYRPILGMLAFSTVFALPFVFLALFPSLMKSMPKSGGWLNAVKVTMGFVELAAAMKFLSNADLIWGLGILTREVVLSVWIGIALMCALYLLGRFRLSHDTPVDHIGPVRMLWSLGFFTVGFWLLTGLFGAPLGELDAFLPPQEYPGKGNTSIFASIGEAGGHSVPPGATTGSADGAESGGSGGGHRGETVLSGNQVMAEGMEWFKDDYAAALAEAKATNRPVFIDFTGYTCTNCRWMESNVFTRDDVRALMSQYVLARLYTDRRIESNKRNQNMQIERFKTVDLPYYVIVTPDDKTIDATVFTRDVDEFKKFLQKGITAVGAPTGGDDVAVR